MLSPFSREERGIASIGEALQSLKDSRVQSSAMSGQHAEWGVQKCHDGKSVNDQLLVSRAMTRYPCSRSALLHAVHLQDLRMHSV